MRKITLWITALLSVGVLLFAYHDNLAGTTSKQDGGNPACATTIATLSANPDCATGSKPGESK